MKFLLKQGFYLCLSEGEDWSSIKPFFFLEVNATSDIFKVYTIAQKLNKTYK